MRRADSASCMTGCGRSRLSYGSAGEEPTAAVLHCSVPTAIGPTAASPCAAVSAWAYSYIARWAAPPQAGGEGGDVLVQRETRPCRSGRLCAFSTVQDMFITPLYQQHAPHTLASRAYGPQPHTLIYHHAWRAIEIITAEVR